MQKSVNSPATPGEGNRVHGMIPALVNAALQAGYLVSTPLAQALDGDPDATRHADPGITESGPEPHPLGR